MLRVRGLRPVLDAGLEMRLVMRCAAALLKMRYPGWPPQNIRHHLLKTAEPGPIPGDPDSFAEGILSY